MFVIVTTSRNFNHLIELNHPTKTLCGTLVRSDWSHGISKKLAEVKDATYICRKCLNKLEG